MNILFITISAVPHLSGHGISLDLIRELKSRGHNVYVVGANDRINNTPTYVKTEEDSQVLRVKILSNKNTNIIEKGLSNLMLPYLYTAAIKKFFKGIKFDLILYPTPPVTQAATVAYIKKRDNAKTYLLLKDIFPQNAVDIGMMTKSGVKSIIYKTFRKKEEKLYKLSDYIGCMSGANVDYILKHNPYLKPEKVHINPNTIEVEPYEKDIEKRNAIREKWGIPEGKTVFVYGGNLGRPQDIPFVIKCLKANANREDCFFVVCGKGTEYKKLKEFYETEKPENLLLLNGLVKAEYEDFVKAFDVGLIFLDHRFTIPNFPSRLLSYMQAKMPVLACTDPNTDIGKVAEEGGFGVWCESNSPENFTKAVDKLLSANLTEMGEAGYNYLKENYTSKQSADIIISKL
ncbi:MAG: glycosyltransferase family 4 protein [Ruminococcaceae bacterium]|nr:glycosyltransferase family 4 protein [Oscillospiraceae bacterium]